MSRASSGTAKSGNAKRFAKSDQSGHRSSDSYELLSEVRKLALEQQGSGPEHFLSLREAAAKFDVSLSSMAGVYRRLREEGILVSLRASKTIVQGRDAIRTLRVRSLIGMPVSIPLLQTLRSYSDCVLYLRQELHRRGFAVLPFYFEDRTVQPEAVVQWAREEKTNAVMWVQPSRLRTETALRLRDCGIQFAGVNIGGVVQRLCRYEVRRQQAIQIILDEWTSSQGLQTAILVRAGPETPREIRRAERLCELAALARLQFEIVKVEGGRITRTLSALSHRERYGILLAGSAGAILGSRASDTIAKIVAAHRIALIDGPIDLPFAQEIPEGAADLVCVNWSALARRIAQDALTGHAFAEHEITTFEAEAQLQNPLTCCREGRFLVGYDWLGGTEDANRFAA